METLHTVSGVRILFRCGYCYWSFLKKLKIVLTDILNYMLWAYYIKMNVIFGKNTLTVQWRKTDIPTIGAFTIRQLFPQNKIGSTFEVI
jgi:hypothetical protein